MISDRFLFRESEKVLDKIELLASCYNFKTREVLQIRLLTEEIMSVISPTLTLSAGGCRVSTDEKCFSVTIDCDAGITGLDANTKKQLMKISRSEKKKGIFGMIGRIFEFLDDPDYDAGKMTGHHMVYRYGVETGMSGYYWNPDFIDVMPQFEPAPRADEKENKEHDLEISIIEGYADDIRVSLQKRMTGTRLEITVTKNFAPNQVEEIEF